MTENIIVQTNKLCKAYGSVQVLSDVSLEIPEGSVYGFLGRNGAGKTTTLKIITGLIKPDSGDCFIFGKSIASERVSILKRTGAIIESPGFYSNLTARENLLLFQSYYRGKDENRVNECLEIVELNDENKVFEKFSLGMKQRLGIAFALLNSPGLLILDEPANGLDPEGIIKLRELIKKFSSGMGITVLISSHILSEVQQIATHIGIIEKGKILRQGKIDDLLNDNVKEYSIIVSNPEKAKLIAGEATAAAFDTGKNELKLKLTKEDAACLLKKLLNNDVEVYSFTYTNNLEDLFFNLTRKSSK